MATIEVSSTYGYVLLVVCTQFFLSTWHGLRVNRFRKRIALPYPNMYTLPDHNITATDSDDEKTKKRRDAYLFNCAQRAHGNFLENLPQTIACMLVAGLKYPILTIVCGLGWCVLRVIYARGYTAEDQEAGKGRLRGKYWFVFQLVLIIEVMWMGVSFALS